ncbi:hypothetical protein TMatcc_006098 [Talaromyces marneffei ATCC 18224]|uniref:Uncharacterized protein n=1 Tax=Talaromyces marneffei PM1 TaxID=1077442 RepID=A0A093UXI3_TALMA|nr:uncharacterized protein EYB26_002930 [Talaromyces marneffei]KAE8554377.1 hypothetical protein EYB25_002916 [Talaromyces marneffei]QGA15273.1 hypothetical protein EYB26_002930 [Talaromyces marneffei]
MDQPRRAHGDEKDEGMHEITRDDTKTEEFTRHESPSTPPPQHTTPLSFPITNSPLASDILRPLSAISAQRSFPLPTSGSLASLARGHQHDRADERRIDRDFEASTATTTRSSPGSSWMHERQLQSDSILAATTTTDPSGLGDIGSSTSNAAVRDFTTMVWESSRIAAATGESTTESKPIQRSGSAYPPSSSFSSPGSSLVEGSSGPLEDDEGAQITPSPFASIFPDGTDTITPVFIQRYDDDKNDCHENTEDADHRTVLKYSESLQLFRRRPEDGGETWKRRVSEYR